MSSQHGVNSNPPIKKPTRNESSVGAVPKVYSTASINEILEGEILKMIGAYLNHGEWDEQPHKIVRKTAQTQKTALYTLIADKVVGADEPQCDCETDPDGLGYHGKWCEQNGLFYGLLRNELKAEQRKILKELFNE